MGGEVDAASVWGADKAAEDGGLPIFATISEAGSFGSMEKRLSLMQRVRSAGLAITGRPLIAGLALLAAASAGLEIIVGVPGLAGGAPAIAATPTATVDAPDIDSLLDGRSPGSRGAGWLVDSKPAYDTPDPVERVLPTVRRRPVFPGVAPPANPTAIIPPALLPYGDVPADGVPGLDGPGPLVSVPSGFPVPGGVPVGVPINGGIPGGGGGNNGDDPGGVGDPGTQVPDPASPVPEPATWMTLILGFMFVGITMRRRGAALAVPA